MTGTLCEAKLEGLPCDCEQCQASAREERIRKSLDSLGERLLASVDTHPKDGDVEQAPLVSGAVPSETSADAQPSVASPKRGPIE